MKLTLTILTFFIFQAAIAQTKEELISSMKMDTVVQFEGEGKLSLGNCLVLKYTGDANVFFDELIKMHANSEKQIETSETRLAIYDTNKPYWIYGNYSVYAEMFPQDNYTLIEIFFEGYSNPDHLKINGAAPTYQALVNKLLGK